MHRFYTSLLALLAPLVSATPTPPSLSHVLEPRASSPTCSNASLRGFEWTVQDFDFHASYVFSTPAHQNSWGYASFNLSNPAVPGARASCSAASSQLSDFFYGNLAYTCTSNAGAAGGPAPATFSFDRPSGELRVNQTWTCDDRDPKYPTTFRAYGKTTLSLNCTDATWQNSNWTSGQIYSDREVKCAHVTVGVAPYKMTAVA